METVTEMQSIATCPASPSGDWAKGDKLLEASVASAALFGARWLHERLGSSSGSCESVFFHISSCRSGGAFRTAESKRRVEDLLHWATRASRSLRRSYQTLQQDATTGTRVIGYRVVLGIKQTQVRSRPATCLFIRPKTRRPA